MLSHSVHYSGDNRKVKKRVYYFSRSDIMDAPGALMSSSPQFLFASSSVSQLMPILASLPGNGYNVSGFMGGAVSRNEAKRRV